MIPNQKPRLVIFESGQRAPETSLLTWTTSLDDGVPCVDFVIHGQEELECVRFPNIGERDTFVEEFDGWYCGERRIGDRIFNVFLVREELEAIDD